MIKYSHLEHIKLKKFNSILFLFNNNLLSIIKFLWLIKLFCLSNKFNNNKELFIINKKFNKFLKPISISYKNNKILLLIKIIIISIHYKNNHKTNYNYHKIKNKSQYLKN
jgi:hypothetical protein